MGVSSTWRPESGRIDGYPIHSGSVFQPPTQEFTGELMATMRVAAKPALAPMKVAQISKPGGDFEIVEREVPEPEAGQVRIKVQACGVCHSDVLTKEGLWPGIQYPRVPGHEVAGVIDEVGAGVSAWKKGQRVGVGWHGGRDGTCRECQRGDFRNWQNLKIPRIRHDGGFQPGNGRPRGGTGGVT